ncbi:DNA double-strand break repair nuclease NurA [Chloroflexota bacterium]
MSLDLTRIVVQIGNMVTALKAGSKQRKERLQHALDVLHGQNDNIDHLIKKIAASKTTWLVAGLTEGFDKHYPTPDLPPEFTIIATDGSHIDVDRHQIIRCYLINIGSVMLHYGAVPHASLESIPHLYSTDEDLVIKPNGAKGREQPIEGTLLGIKRSVEECQQLTDMAASLPTDSPILALVDGTLVLWGLEAYPEFISEELLDKGFLKCLSTMNQQVGNKKLALASYISFPRSTEVVNALRVALCPYDVPNCDRYCPLNQDNKCDAVKGIRDRELFTSILGEGERSTIFFSQSSVVRKHYGENKIYFFYVRLKNEIARVEIPEWVALDENRLNLAHSLVLDQCLRGQGYPVALSEAHEKAVVTGVDRDEFWHLVESFMVDEQLPSITSAKSQSKRTRWV